MPEEKPLRLQAKLYISKTPETLCSKTEGIPGISWLFCHKVRALIELVCLLNMTCKGKYQKEA